MIQRLITSTLLEYLQHFPAVGLIGARQVGKTTLAKSLSTQFSNPVRYFDLERLEDFQLLSNDPGFFLSQYENDCVIIDEVQRLPALFSELRALIDQKRTNGRFLLLGSAAPLLMKQSADSLAGRIAYLTMHPFHLLEIGDEQTDIRNHWWRGGFPDAWLAENDAWSMTWREQFIRTYVERDLPFLGLRTDPVRFSIFLQMLASVNGQLWNAESIGRSLGTSGNTVKTYRFSGKLVFCACFTSLFCKSRQKIGKIAQSVYPRYGYFACFDWGSPARRFARFCAGREFLGRVRDRSNFTDFAFGFASLFLSNCRRDGM
jgi:predicted AAA+ superfamily ATPase